MKLSNFTAQRLFSALRNIDANEAIKLPGSVRLDIARNINRLTPLVSAYERVVQRRSRDLQPGDAGRAANNQIAVELEQLADSTDEIDLIEIDCDQLRLDDNPRITADFVASLAPILKSFDSFGKS